MSQSGETKTPRYFTTNRIEALTDGVFAIVMTLLVLEIVLPETAQPLVQAELPGRIIELWPKLLSYLLSFIALGFFWYIHHFSFHYIKRSDYGLVWLNILFLMFIALMPFSTSILGTYGIQSIPYAIYISNILLALIARFAFWVYAVSNNRLVDSDINPQLVKSEYMIQGGGCIALGLIIGISFINAVAALSIFIVVAVFNLIMARRILGRAEKQ